ncbi:hypothetical protein [Aquibium oceanicum]|uniref:Uncharacterized protein n=1 Tax=Aquibium oceanicum TaxID=1670800 RepID=A0A1L3SPC2_9HYPH|nr:hypothetical protein [Aquibium oceanicum]APH71142.1 hypothetical protein BSQ44_06980 [Aquibium oceanicum]
MTEVQTFASRAIALRSARRQGLTEGTYTLEKDATTGRHYIAQFSAVPTPKKVTAKKGAASKRPPVAQGKNLTDGPVAQVRAFYLANPDIDRKAFIAELVGKRGLNANMVSTRWQWLRSGKDPATRPYVQQGPAQ